MIRVETPYLVAPRRRKWFLQIVDPDPQESSDAQPRWRAAGDYLRGQAEKPARMFALWAFWLSGLYFMLGPASYVRVVDAGNGSLPARMWAGEALAHGKLSDWFPLACCGSDRVLNAYCLELPSLLFAFLPGWLAYGAVMYLQRFVAGYFFYRLMRDDLRTTLAAAYAAGLAYSLYYQPGIHYQWDGFQLYEGFGVPALPLLLWGIHRLHESRSRWRYVMAGTSGVVLALSANYFQSIFFPLLVMFWLVCIRRVIDRRMFAVLIMMLAGATAVQLPQIVASAEFAPISQRADMVITSQSDYVKHIENVQYLPRLIFNFNSLLITVGCVGLVFSRFRERRLLWTLLALAVVLGFVRYYYIFTDHVFSHLGPLAGFHFHRILILLPFLVSLATGLGIEGIGDQWRFQINDNRWRWGMSIGTAAFLVAVAHLTFISMKTNSDRYKNMIHGESFERLYHHPEVEAIAALKQQLPPFRVACVTDAFRPGLGVAEARNWTFAPGYAWAYGLETADGYLVLYSHRYKKFWSQVLSGLFRHDIWCYQKHECWGNMVYLWKSGDTVAFQYLYKFVLGSLADVHLTVNPRGKLAESATNIPFRYLYDLDLLSLANVRFIFSPIPLDDRRLRLLPSEFRDQLVKRNMRSDRERLAGIFSGECTWQPMYVYENQACLPRYQFVGSVRLCNGEAATLAALGQTKAEQFATQAIVNLDDVRGVDLDYLGGRGEVRVISSNPDVLELEVNCDARGMVVIANTYSPDWHADIDGQPAQILPANYTFQGVVVDQGVHRVRLHYQSSASWAALLAELTSDNRSSIR